MALSGIGKGDEVILPSFTFPSTANEIIHLGAKPVFMDIEPVTFNLDPALLESKITPRTKAIIPTHYGGHSCDMDKIFKIAKRHGIPVIEDAAHAHGSLYKGKRIGSLNSYATCFSFYPTKNLTTAEGGMITVPKKQVADQLRVLSLHGISKDAWKRYDKAGSWYYEILAPGYKYNLPDLLSALGLAQLKKLELMNQARLKIAAYYDKLFLDVEELQCPVTQSYATRNGHLYTMMGKHWTYAQRNAMIEYLREWNIGTSVHFIPTHRHPYYRDRFKLKSSDFPVTEDVFTKIISLPIYPQLTRADQDYIVSVVKQGLLQIR
jgi:dTDP-4-amino-4,6-dideoxygalactose transaminase